jgi:hypothetical protein
MMPIEYLEKIFQIPFAMPEMAEDGYRKLIASLAPSALTPQPGETVLSAPDPRRGLTSRPAVTGRRSARSCRCSRDPPHQARSPST